MLSDLRYACRLLVRSPGFTAAVVLTIALAIGANTTIFTVANAVLLRPLPFPDPNRLVQIAEKNDKLKLPSFGASVPNFLSWREQTRAFDEIAGVLVYSVSQRTHEIGVRMALDATQHDVLTRVVREGLRVVLVGLTAGVAGGLALGRTMASLVFGVSVHDAVTFAAACLVLTAVALSACVIPARRAARIDPLGALRYDA